MIQIRKPRYFQCEDCDEEGIYHIQTTEVNYWLCKIHMMKAWENTQKINEISLNQLYAKQIMETVKHE